MEILVIVFLYSLLLGQFGGIQIFPGVTVFLHDVLTVFILGLFSFHIVVSKKEIKASLSRPILYFIGIAVISLLLNIGKFSYIQLLLGSLYLVRFILYAGLYIVVRNEHIPARVWLTGLYIVGVGMSILGFVQYVFMPSLKIFQFLGWDEHYYRLFSTLLDPNFTGLFLVLSFFLGLYLHSSTKKIYITIGQLLLGIALILTYSRSSFLAFGIALLVYVFLSKQKIILLTLVFGSLLYAGLPSHGLDVNRLFRADSSVARIQSYVENIQTIKLSPIIGIGYNMLRYQAGREKMLDSDGIVSRDASGFNSSLLVIAATTGIVGFVLFIYLLFRMTVLIAKKRDTLSYVGLASMIAILVHSMFNNSLLYSWILIWLWIVTGAIEKINNKK